MRNHTLYGFKFSVNAAKMKLKTSAPTLSSQKRKTDARLMTFKHGMFSLAMYFQLLCCQAVKEKSDRAWTKLEYSIMSN